VLIGFTLSNFRSFLEETNFAFVASGDHTHETTHCMRTGMKSIPRLSKTAIIFGPNGSGSSPRKRENIAKGYLRGRYGAIPDIKRDLYTLTLKAKKPDALIRGQPKFVH
jgi:hypothetical protein